MNFRIVEGVQDDFSNIYDDFERDYLDTALINDELRKKYDLSKKNFQKLSSEVKQKHGLKKRPSRPIYYYKHNTGYYISKKIDGKRHYIGHVPTEELAIHAVEVCKMLNWNVVTCRLAVKELKQCQ